MSHSLFLTPLILLIGCSRLEQYPETTRGIAVAVERLTSEGTQILYSHDGSPWRTIAEGTSPALSPSGRHLAFLHHAGSEYDAPRFVRILDIETGQTTPVTKFEGSNNQTQPTWNEDGRLVLFLLFIDEHGYHEASISYPTLNYARPPESRHKYRPVQSSDGKFEVRVEHTPSGFAVFLLDLEKRSRIRVTPPTLCVAPTVAPEAFWLDATHEILFSGQWREDYGVDGKTYVYRIDPLARDWSKATKAEWDSKRLCKGARASIAAVLSPVDPLVQ